MHNEKHIHCFRAQFLSFQSLYAMRTLSFDDFLETPQGQTLLEWESAQYDEIVSDAFGYSALQVGCPGLDTLKDNRIARHWLTDTSFERLDTLGKETRFSPVQAESAWLPFESDSMDLVTLPHTLDFSESPQQALREAARVLHPEGRVVLTAFNPMSLWWLRQKGVALGCNAYLPSRAVPISLYRLKDWLTLLGFEIDRGRFGIYTPWCRSMKTFRRWNWLNKAGDRWAPHCANLIMLSAVKRLPGTNRLEASPLEMAAEIITGRKPLPVRREAHKEPPSAS